LRITDGETNAPLLERLIFFRPSKDRTVDFNLSVDRKEYQPGDKVSINIGVAP
jgi:hypothetical protein